jgi:zinc transport system ATP-binding protein
MPISTSPLIQASGLHYQYQTTPVLEDVSFTVEKGDFVGIIGPNGSGKTTLLKLILGLLKPTVGQIRVLGETVKLGAHAKVIGYIPQKVTQSETHFPITVEEVVALGRIAQQKPWQHQTATDQKIITASLEIVELLPFRKRLLSELSGGQQQRVFIAKALAGEPELLILDEPTIGIDLESQESFYALLARLNKKNKLTILMVSHDIDVIMNEVTSVLCLNKHLIYHGSPQNFLKEEYLEKLYGKNQKFIIHAH